MTGREKEKIKLAIEYLMPLPEGLDDAQEGMNILYKLVGYGELPMIALRNDPNVKRTPWPKTAHKPNKEQFLVGDIVKCIRLQYDALNADDWPQEGIESHFGVSQRCGIFSVGLSTRGLHLLITVYNCYLWKEHELVGFPEERFQQLVKAIREDMATNMREYWNGCENGTGISIVLDLLCPASLRQAQRNYRNQKDVFNHTETESKAWSAWSTWYKERKRLVVPVS